MRHNRPIFCFLAPVVPLLSQSASPVQEVTSPQSDKALDRPSHYFYGFGGQSAQIFGSQDQRYGFGFGGGYGGPEPRLARGSIKAQLVYEAYYDQTGSESDFNVGRTDTYAGGILSYGRWFWPRDSLGRGMFADLGWGFQYADHQTFDLDTRLNSTPIIGFGALFPTGDREFLLSLRLLHISNGGTDLPNRGQNEFLILLGVRY